jgi:ABC-2 type transport system ATP-binding protein
MTLRISGLRARYPGRTSGEALRGLDLELEAGSVYALLGPNGAGKTSLLRCLTGILRPASGSIRVLGVEAATRYPPELLRRLGVLVESPAAYGRMTAREYLRYFTGFYFPEDPETRIGELAAAFEFDGLATRVGRLSQGNRRKVQLLRSLLHGPELVLWDEPTEHLDPRAQRLALEALRRHVAAGATALITSHRLEQMQDFADVFGFLRDGRVTLALRREVLAGQADEAEIEGQGGIDSPACAALRARLGSDCEPLPPPGAGDGENWILRLRGKEAAATLSEWVDAVVRGGGRVLRAAPRRNTLESLYRRHVEDSA